MLVLVLALLACDRAPADPVVTDSPAPDPPVEAPAEVPAFQVSLTCEMHGTAISTTRTEVTSEPPAIRDTVNDDPPREGTLTEAELATLWAIVDGEPLAGFVAETPPEGPAAPGQTFCTLAVAHPDGEVEKKWTSTDEYSEAAVAARGALMVELTTLRKALPPP